MKKVGSKLTRLLGWLIFWPSLLFTIAFVFLLFANDISTSDRITLIIGIVIFGALSFLGFWLLRSRKKQEKDSPIGQNIASEEKHWLDTVPQPTDSIEKAAPKKANKADEKSAKKARITELEQLIREYQESYYDGEPGISDNDFDLLWDELKRLNPNSKILKKIEIPEKAEKSIKKKSVPRNIGKGIFRIVYIDGHGDSSERDIKIIRLDPGDPAYIYAYCFLRKENRSFRVDRIVAVYKDGEAIQKPTDYLLNLDTEQLAAAATEDLTPQQLAAEALEE